MAPPREDDHNLNRHIDDFLRDYGGDPQMRAVGLLMQSQNTQNLAIVRVVYSIQEAQQAYQQESKKWMSDHEEWEVKKYAESTQAFTNEIASIHAKLTEEITAVHEKFSAQDLAKAREEGAATERDKAKQQARENRAAREKRMWSGAGIIASILTAGLAGLGYLGNQQIESLKEIAKQVQMHENRLVRIDTELGLKKRGP